MQTLGQADFVIEAINECETSKKAAFLLLDKAGFPLPAQTLRCACQLNSVRFLHSTLLRQCVLPSHPSLMQLIAVREPCM